MAVARVLVAYEMPRLEIKNGVAQRSCVTDEARHVMRLNAGVHARVTNVR